MSPDDRDDEDAMKQKCEEMPPANDEQVELTRVAFNFDEWLQLARENPEEFERRREQLIRETVSQMNTENMRTHGLNWRIDMERMRSGDPVDNLMWMMGEMKACLAKLREECVRQARALGKPGDK